MPLSLAVVSQSEEVQLAEGISDDIQDDQSADTWFDTVESHLRRTLAQQVSENDLLGRTEGADETANPQPAVPVSLLARGAFDFPRRGQWSIEIDYNMVMAVILGTNSHLQL